MKSAFAALALPLLPFLILPGCAAMTGARERPQWSFNYVEKNERQVIFTGRSNEMDWNKKLKKESEQAALNAAARDCYNRAEGYFGAWLDLQLTDLQYRHPTLTEALAIEFIRKQALEIFARDAKYIDEVIKPTTKDGQKTFKFIPSRILKTENTHQVLDEKEETVCAFIRQSLPLEFLVRCRTQGALVRRNAIQTDLAKLSASDPARSTLLEAAAVLEQYGK